MNITQQFHQAKNNTDRAQSWQQLRQLSLCFPQLAWLRTEAAQLAPSFLERDLFFAQCLRLSEELAPFTSRPSLEVHNTDYGVFALPRFPEQDVIRQAIISNDIFDRDIVEAAYGVIKPRTSVIDLGANFGQMTVIFAQLLKYQSGYCVYSVEADDYLSKIISVNLELNKVSDYAKVYNNAVHKIPDIEVNFPYPDWSEFTTYGCFGIRPDLTQSTRKVKTITVDQLAISEPVSLLKVDTQGSDLWALQGAVATIAKHKMPIIFEFEPEFQHRFNTSFKDYEAFVKGQNYVWTKQINHNNWLISHRG